MHAVVDVDLEVGEGKLVGLIGPNGAGKTTFIDAISGFVRSRGRVELDGHDLTRLAPHARARLGLARTWQSIELFDDLSVRENLLRRLAPAVGLADVPGRRSRGPIPATGEIDPALELLGLESVADAMPNELSQGQRKLVGIARALVAKPRLVCLDEPAAGLDTHESEELGRRLRSLADAGQAMLLVDHDMGLVLGICDEVVVLEFGKVIARGAGDMVRRDEAVIAAYLGSAGSRAGGGGRGCLRPCSTLEGLTAGYDEAAVIRDLDLTVGPGEVVALLGANGAGKTTTLRVVSGLVKPMDGRVLFEGEDLARSSPSARARVGIAHVPEGRGLFFGLTVAEHFRLAPRDEQLDEELAYEYFPKLTELQKPPRRPALRRRAADARRRPGARPEAEAAAPRRAQPRSRAGDRRAAAAGRAAVRARSRELRRPARRAARPPGARGRRPRLRPLARPDRARERRGAPAGRQAAV